MALCPSLLCSFAAIKDALNIHGRLLTGALLQRDPSEEQSYSASISRRSQIKLSTIHLWLTFAHCFLLKLALVTSILNICFCSCLHGSSRRFSKWKSSFSWGLQGHPRGGFSSAVCVGKRFVFPFPFVIKPQIWPCCDRLHAMSESRWSEPRFLGWDSVLSQPERSISIWQNCLWVVLSCFCRVICFQNAVY